MIDRMHAMSPRIRFAFLASVALAAAGLLVAIVFTVLAEPSQHTTRPAPLIVPAAHIVQPSGSIGTAQSFTKAPAKPDHVTKPADTHARAVVQSVTPAATSRPAPAVAHTAPVAPKISTAPAAHTGPPVWSFPVPTWRPPTGGVHPPSTCTGTPPVCVIQ